MGNNQMLAGDPVTSEIRRFMTDPNGSEVTGITWSAGRRTMFIGTQHPGGSFPGGEGARPSVIKPGIVFMLSYFKEGLTGGQPSIKYKLSGHFESGQDKLNMPLGIDFSFQLFF